MRAANSQSEMRSRDEGDERKDRQLCHKWRRRLALWPLSRARPKQFHDLAGQGSMLTKTLRRLAARPGGGAIFEPMGRNTAAAVAVATGYARKLYASAIAKGLNRATGLAYAAVSRGGLPLDRLCGSSPQAEAIKAVVALDGTVGPNLAPEVEERVGRLFRWHIDPAPLGLWIDRIEDRGRSVARDVPASIFHHLVCSLTQYLDSARNPKEGS